MSPQVRRALLKAAERIGANNWDALLKRHRGKGLPRYIPTPAHMLVVDTLNRRDEVSDDEAMALLWTPEVLRERGVL